MSVKAMSRVWELDLHQGERLILLALADHADHLGGNIHPSVALIAWKTGYSERQVQRIMQALVADGLLIVERDGGGRGHATSYRFDLHAGTVKAPYIAPGMGDTMSPIGVNGDTMSPIGVNGDTMSPIPAEERVTFETERVTSATLKGDIFDVKGDIAMSPESINHQGTIRGGGHAREGNAPPPPPLADQVVTEEPAVAIYEELFDRALSPEQRAIIVARVVDLVRWRRCCDDWKLNGYKAANLSGLLDRYGKPDPPPEPPRSRSSPRRGPPPGEPPGETITEIKQRTAGKKAELMKGLPAGL